MGGYFLCNSNFDKYETIIQKQCDQKGVLNITEFNYRIPLSDNTELTPVTLKQLKFSPKLSNP